MFHTNPIRGTTDEEEYAMGLTGGAVQGPICELSAQDAKELLALYGLTYSFSSELVLSPTERSEGRPVPQAQQD